jgi:hypothetical protein
MFIYIYTCEVGDIIKPAERGGGVGRGLSPCIHIMDMTCDHHNMGISIEYYILLSVR